MSPCKQNGVVRKVQSRSKLLPRTHPAEINKVAQETLERYSHIPVQDIAPHVERVVSSESPLPSVHLPGPAKGEICSHATVMIRVMRILG